MTTWRDLFATKECFRVHVCCDPHLRAKSRPKHCFGNERVDRNHFHRKQYSHRCEMNTITPTNTNTATPTLLPEGLTEEMYTRALEFAAHLTPIKTNALDVAPSLPDGLTEEVYAKALDFAKLASKTYDWDDYAVARIGMNLFAGIDDVKAQDFRTPNYVKIRGGGDSIDLWGGDDHGLDYTLFQHKDTGDMVLAFRGTEPLSVEDWLEDIKQAFGTAKQYKNAVSLTKSLQAKAKKNGTLLFLTGHSLGGGLATAAALSTGCEAIVFDSAGVSDDTIRNLHLNVEKHAQKVTNFNVRECFVSDWNKKMDDTTIGSGALGKVSKQKQYGRIFWLESVSDRADFKLLPDWTRTAKRAESVLSHAWHVFTYQLEHKYFVRPKEVHYLAEEDEDCRPAKKQKT